jgi:hypothetical protein
MEAVGSNMKTCPKCNKIKHPNDFGKCTREKDGKYYLCKECANEKTRNSYQKHKEKRREKNRGRKRIRSLDYHKKKKNTRMFLMYGITEQDYENLLNDQYRKCKICKSVGSDISGGGLVIDHDHKTNKVRGLICGRCNVMLGLAKDSLEILTSTIEYLKSEPTRFVFGRKKKYNKNKGNA